MQVETAIHFETDPAVMELVTVFETLWREGSTPVTMPIFAHNMRLPSQDRAVTLHFLAAIRCFYAVHGGLQFTMERVCKGGRGAVLCQCKEQ